MPFIEGQAQTPTNKTTPATSGNSSRTNVGSASIPTGSYGAPVTAATGSSAEAAHIQQSQDRLRGDGNLNVGGNVITLSPGTSVPDTRATTTANVLSGPDYSGGGNTGVKKPASPANEVTGYTDTATGGGTGDPTGGNTDTDKPPVDTPTQPTYDPNASTRPSGNGSSGSSGGGSSGGNGTGYTDAQLLSQALNAAGILTADPYQLPEVSGPNAQPVDHVDTTQLKEMLQQILDSQTQQSQQQVDYTVQQGVNELTRAMEDAATQYQTQRNQATADEMRARIYWCMIYDNGMLVRNYVPCLRVSDGKPGLYDFCGSICSITNSPFYPSANANGEFTDIGGIVL